MFILIKRNSTQSSSFKKKYGRFFANFNNRFSRMFWPIQQKLNSNFSNPTPTSLRYLSLIMRRTNFVVTSSQHHLVPSAIFSPSRSTESNLPNRELDWHEFVSTVLVLGLIPPSTSLVESFAGTGKFFRKSLLALVGTSQTGRLGALLGIVIIA